MDANSTAADWPPVVDDEGRTARRRIMMHEFLMTGGVQTGNDKGKAIYSPPIVAAAHEVCPWHAPNCEAWAEIRAGRGVWTKLEDELSAARVALVVEKDDDRIASLKAEIAALDEKLEMRPMDARALRSRTPEEFAVAKAAAKSAREAFQKAVGDAGKLAAAHTRPGAAKLSVGQQHAPSVALHRRDGTVDEATVLCSKHLGLKSQAFFFASKETFDFERWFVIPKNRYECGGCLNKVAESPERPKATGNPWDKRDNEYEYEKLPEYEPLPEDSRDLAIDAFAEQAVPDAIVFDSEDEDEDEDEDEENDGEEAK